MRVGSISVALLVAAGLGCNFNPAKQCNSNTDCVNGATCDVGRHTCVFSPDAGPLTVAIGSAPSHLGADGGTWMVDPQGNAWRRDEVIPVSVAASGTIVSGTWSVTGLAADGGGVPGVAHALCDAGTCTSFVFAAWEPELDALRGTVVVNVSATDSLGRSSSGTAQTKVTRWKWAEKLGNAIEASPAIGPKGIIYVGTDDTTSGKLWALNPADGTSVWPQPFSLGPVVSSPAVGASGTIYVAEADAGSSFLYALSGIDAGIIAACGRSASATVHGPFLGGIGIAGSPTEGALAVGNDSSVLGSLVSNRPFDPINTCLNQTTGSPQLPPSSTATNDFSAYLGDPSGEVRRFDYSSSPVGWGAAWTWISNGTNVPALGVLDGGILGTVNVDGAFELALDGGALGRCPSVGTGSVVPGSPVVDSNGNAIYGAGTAIYMCSPPAITGNTIANTIGPVIAAPVLGQGGIVYVADQTGNFDVFDPSLNEKWSAPLGTAGFFASANLDCHRSSNGTANGGPGNLYLADQGGTIYSIIVDSPALDPTSPWPKYQHDNRNSGNPSTPLTCP